MTPEEREEMSRLCLLIQDEKDHQKFRDHIAKLIELLGRKKQRMEARDQHEPQTSKRPTARG
jgi:hypothetical protein